MTVPVLREFQARTVERVVEAARNRHRVIVVQSATGSGKSSIGCGLVQRALEKDKRVLFTVHRRRLVDQMSDRLMQFHIDHGVFMRGHKYEKDCRVQVASRDTMVSRCVNHEWCSLPPADLVIVDEGRHAVSPKYKSMLDYYQQQGAVLVLLDATPVLADGRGLGPWATSLIVAEQTSKLIQDGYLVPVRCFAPDRKMRGKRVLRGVAGDLVESWKAFAENRSTVLFCSRVAHSIDAVAAFQQAGITAAHVDAETPDHVRDQIFDQVESGEIKVLSNVGIIGEGVDIPILACCQFFMDPASRTRFLQGAGRVMRPYEGKPYGIIIDHAAAVFRHGFPDEDMEWTLEGNVDEKFAEKHAAGLTEKALYCSHCERVYKGSETCPDCGRRPAKRPRSLFEAPGMDSRDELLTEAERCNTGVFSDEEKKVHWLRCLGVAKSRNSTFGMAAQIYKRKYNEWPAEGFPCFPPSRDWKRLVVDVFPTFGKRRSAQGVA